MARPKIHNVTIVDADGKKLSVSPADFGYAITESQVIAYLNSLDVSGDDRERLLEKELCTRRAVTAYRIDILNRYLDDVAAGRTQMTPAIVDMISAIAPRYVAADRAAADKLAAAKEKANKKEKEHPAAQPDVPQLVPADDNTDTNINY